MIEASFPLPDLECAGEARTIRGVAVPWNTIGRVSDGRQVKFLPGSLDAAARPISLRDHDRSRPIGVVADATDDGTHLRAVVKVSATREGDEALILAADRVLRALSVGANPTRHHMDGDVLVVEAADWHELSVLPFGAFQGAEIMDVAASTPTEPDEPDEPDDPAVPEEEAMPDTAGPSIIPVTAAPPPQAITIRRLAEIYAAAPDRQKGSYVEAALTAVTSTGNAGVLQRTYLSEVKGLVEFGRPTINAISNAALPPAGMRVEWPVWTTLPTVQGTTGEKVAVPTGAVSITTGGVDVAEFAGAADISMRLAQRSNPSFMEQYFRGCAEQYARLTNLYVVNNLLAGATAVTPVATFLGSLQAIIASFDPTVAPNGPLFVAMSWDLGAVLVGITYSNGPAFWSGSINFGSLPAQMTADGLNLYVDRQLPVKTLLAGFASGATWYEDPQSPAEIRVVDVSLLGIDAGVYGYGALGFNYPVANAFRKITYTTLPTTEEMAGAEPIEASAHRAKK